MILPDVNVLISAHRAEQPDHPQVSAWLRAEASSERAFGLADLVLSGFLRVVTNRRVFAEPTPPQAALSFVEGLRERPNCVPVAPGPRHWPLFTSLCRTVGARGNLVPDAYLAALAIESGSEWVTSDRGFARFPGLRWRLPGPPA